MLFITTTKLETNNNFSLFVKLISLSKFSSLIEPKSRICFYIIKSTHIFLENLCQTFFIDQLITTCI